MLMGRAGGAQVIMVVIINGPKREPVIITRNGLRITKGIGPRGQVLVLLAVKRPELPPGKPRPVTQMEEWIYIVIRDHVPLPRGNVERPHHEKDLVTKK